MRGIIRNLKSHGFQVQVHDPVVDGSAILRDWGIELQTRDQLIRGDAVILGVAHDEFVSEGWNLAKGLLHNSIGVVADIKGCLDRELTPAGVDLWRL